MGNNSNPTKNKNSHIQIDPNNVQEVICQIPSSRNLQFEVFLFNRRKNTYMKNVVAITSVKPVIKTSLSSLQKQVVKIHLEKVLCKLSQVELNFDQANYVLKEALRGFSNLVNYYGRSFIITQDMICLSQSQEIKVWLNSDFAQNYIDQELSEPISQIQMFAYLVNSICRNVQPSADRQLIMEMARMAEESLGNLNQKSLEQLNKNYLQKIYQSLQLTEIQIQNLRESQVQSEIQIMQLNSRSSPIKDRSKPIKELSTIQQFQRSKQRKSIPRKTDKPFNHLKTDPNTEPYSQTQRIPTYLSKQYGSQMRNTEGDDSININATIKDNKILNFSKNAKSYSIEQTAESNQNQKYIEAGKNTQKGKHSKYAYQYVDNNHQFQKSSNFYKDKAITPKKHSFHANFNTNQINEQVSGQQRKIPAKEAKKLKQKQSQTSKNPKYYVKLEIQTPSKEILPKVQLSFCFEKQKKAKGQTSRYHCNSSRQYEDCSQRHRNQKQDEMSQSSYKSSRPMINVIGADKKIKDKIIQQFENDSKKVKHAYNSLLKSSSQKGKIHLEISRPSEIYRQQKYQIANSVTQAFPGLSSNRNRSNQLNYLKQNDAQAMNSSEFIYIKNDDYFKDLLGTFSNYLQKYQQGNDKQTTNIFKRPNLQ